MRTKLIAVILTLAVSVITGCDSDSGDGDSKSQKVNFPPIFLSSAPTVAQVGVAYTYNVKVIDVDAASENITIEINAHDTCLGDLVDNGDGDGVYTFTPDAAQINTDCDVGLTASDGNLRVDQVATVHIGDENAAPYFTSTALATATEDVLYTYNITVADDNIPAQSLTITAGAFNTCGGAVVDDGDGTGSYSFTSDESDGGEVCLLSLTVTDSMGLSVDQNTVITINEDNKAPSFTSTAPTTATEGIEYSYNIITADADVPEQTLTLTLSAGNTCGGAINDFGDGFGEYSFTPGETTGNTQCVVGITITDSIGSSANQNTLITINEVNVAPYFTSTSPTSVSEGVAYSYNPTYTDADLPNAAPGDPGYVTCAASNNTCGAWLTITGCNASGTPAESDAPGNCGYRLTIQDGLGLTAIQNVTLSLNEVNAAPSFTSTAATTASEAILYSYSITIGDSDLPANAITILTNGSDTCNGTLVDNGNRTGTYTFTPNELQGGTTCVVGLIATDNGSPVLSVTQNTTVTIAEVNLAPSFTSTGPTTATEGVLYTYTATVTDPDLPAQTLTCSKNGDTCGGTLTGCAYTFTPTETQGGTTCVVGLRVSDGALTADQNTTVAVSETNQAPVWSAAPTDLSVVTGQTYSSTNGTATDADLPSQTLTCSRASSTCSFTVNVSGSGTSPRNCSMSFTAGANPETCGVGVQVSDGAGGTITQNVMISVQQCRKFVKDDATGTNDGSSWANAYNVIQDAVDASWSGCEIWVAEGDYYKKTAGTGSVLTMKSGVDIYGGFVGVESSLGDRLYPAVYPTYLDGEDTSYHVVVGASNARLDGFYITGGNANGSSPNGNGGGMYNSGVSNLIIANNIFSGNSAANWGGGIFNLSSSTIITNCAFLGNSGYYGGGIYNYSSSPTITDCAFSGNSADYDGGGIYNDSSSPTITNCAFSGNTAQYSSGGIYNAASSPTITNCAFSGNTAQYGGGGIYNASSSPTITDCAFSGNSAYYGGGILNLYNSPTITNCVFSGNSGYYGGGIYNDISSPTITNCAFSGNTAQYGGGMYNYNTSSPTITNCIIWGNTAITSDPSIYNDATSTPIVTYSDIQGGYAGTGNINSDPLFVAGTYGNYYLSQTASGQASNSPCLNAGSATAASLGLATRTTRTDNVADSGTVDMGYHYPIP